MTSIMAIDPGMTTGIAARLPDGTYWTGLAHTLEEVITFLLDIQPDIVIYERFATAGRISQYGLQTVELVGMIRGMAQTLAYLDGKQIKLIRCTPAQRKMRQFEADYFVRHEQGNSQRLVHCKDALAHLFAWEVRNGIRSAENTRVAQPL